MSDDPHLTATITALRARAQLARKLAANLPPSDATVRRLRELADELEAEADALERQSPP